MIEKLFEGMILKEEVEDSIDPITLIKENVRYEKVIVEGISKKYVKLWNLERCKSKIIDKNLMDVYLKHNLYKITGERG